MLVDLWVVHPTPATCERCYALEGHYWPVGTPHPEPPLHPHCRCSVIQTDIDPANPPPRGPGIPIPPIIIIPPPGVTLPPIPIIIIPPPEPEPEPTPTPRPWLPIISKTHAEEPPMPTPKPTRITLTSPARFADDPVDVPWGGAERELNPALLIPAADDPVDVPWGGAERDPRVAPAARRYSCTLIAAGPLIGWYCTLPADVMTRDAAVFSNLTAFADHPALSEHPRIEKIIGVFANVTAQADRITAELVLKPTAIARALQPLLDQVVADQQAGQPTPDIGLSANLWLELAEQPNADGRYDITQIVDAESVDIVFRPASRPARLHNILAHVPGQSTKEPPMEPIALTAGTPTAPAPDPAAYIQRLATATLDAALHAAHLPAPAETHVRAQFANHAPTPAEIDGAITDQRTLIAALSQPIAGHDRPLDGGRVSGMRTGADEAQEIANWMFGVRSAGLPEPRMRSPREFYRAFTGDLEFRGRTRPEHALFAAATTTSLADLAANASNKVFMETWEALPAYRWFEKLTTVAPNDGSVKAMAWITFGGIANLPVVAEGGAYTEASVADAKESDSFVKQGVYLGITEELWRNDDLQRLQMIPRVLAVAALRTRSANMAAIFSQASGVGPTLDDDSVVLFHTATHANLATTAFSIAAWKAARLECYKITELGSSKRLGIWPKYCLVPGDLYDDALVAFGYGAGPSGYPGTANNDVHPYAMDRPGDPRPTPIAVPDWTDTNDWAYLADPNEYPVLMMSYAQNPGGRSHPMPEIFSVTSPLAGLIFTNDTLPVKVRDWYAYGVSGYRGVGKRNV